MSSVASPLALKLFVPVGAEGASTAHPWDLGRTARPDFPVDGITGSRCRPSSIRLCCPLLVYRVFMQECFHVEPTRHAKAVRLSQIAFQLICHPAHVVCDGPPSCTDHEAFFSALLGVDCLVPLQKPFAMEYPWYSCSSPSRVVPCC